ncbi:MAG: carboxypeptidase regulatory-like domain-containing protein, partial [Cyclobacteriaceae bacterium]|nr:carboxypeptidase regulatory-like domain-containing protein [Cyclobacteriaceae bacterium]
MQNLKIGLATVVGILFSYVVCGQELKQQIRGRVTDAITGQPLIGAYVIVGEEADPLAGSVTDHEGRFVIDQVVIGRYNLIVSFTGYRTVKLPEVLVQASRPPELNISLSPGIEEMEGLVISSQMDPLTIEGIGTRTITPEQTLRFASTYFDVARLTTAYPGVSLYNDQGNNIISRGHSPNSIQWKLEGVEIVNPNHLSNTGTLSDRPTQSGGGVNILSNQMLTNSKFINGGMSTDYGNGLSGYYDMFFRKGNTEKHEFVVQASLIGIDLTAEGPLKKESNNSYLINYRYSFVGLLTGMGIDFGGESISFQDLAFN